MTLLFGLKSPEPEKIVRAAGPTGTFTLTVEYVAGNNTYTQVQQDAISCSSPITINDPFNPTYTITPGVDVMKGLIKDPPDTTPISITITGPNSATSLTLIGKSEGGLYAKISKITGSFPTGLKSLTMYLGSENSTYPTIPNTCTSVDFGESRGLTSLSLVSTGVTTITGLPSTLQYLGLHRCTALTALPTLPESLRTLVMFPKYTTGAIPSQITALNLSACTALTTLPSIPNLVTDLAMFPKYTTGPIPSQITTLNLSPCTVMTTLPSLPSLLKN